MGGARSKRLDGRCSITTAAVVTVVAVVLGVTAPARADGAGAIAWGENWHGQLGASFRSQREQSPIPVEGLSAIRSVVAATSFNLALLDDGTVAAWGGDLYGQLGDNGRKANWELGKSHVSVSGLSGVKALAAANEHALALMSDGTVRAWGNNQTGQLGNGKGGFESVTGQNERVPTTVEGLTHVTAIAAGGASNFALLENGTVVAWGFNGSGQLGIAWPERCQSRNLPECGQYECMTEVGSVLCSTRPSAVLTAAGKPLSDVVAIAAGAETAYALLKSGEVVSWGSNLDGALGQAGMETGPHNRFKAPGNVMLNEKQPLTGVVELAAGYNHALARLSTGAVVGWGNDAEGELGQVSSAQIETCRKHHPEVRCVQMAQPITLPGGQVEAIAAATQFSVALIGHKVYAWGRDRFGELGDGGVTSSQAPRMVAGIGSVNSISAAGGHVVALLASGVQPPPSPLTLHPIADGLQLGWTGTGGRVVDRVFERPIADEAEEEIAEAEEAEAASTGSEAGALQNTTRPRIKGEPREGQQLAATSGTWAGAEPTLFEYQWQRCRAGECVPIPGATSAMYVPGPTDVGYALQFVITAVGSGEAVCAAVSFPTPLVKSDAEGRRSKVESMRLGGSPGPTLISQIYGAPLEPLAYELKVTIDDNVRVIVGTPLPGAGPAPAPTPVGAPRGATPTPENQPPTCAVEASRACSKPPPAPRSAPAPAPAARTRPAPTRPAPSHAPAARVRPVHSVLVRAPGGSRRQSGRSHRGARANGLSGRRPA
jgi:alpha-tubulin suppressor-like RCC1 family protein